ncbi:MAG: Hsp20/alpha crystallin family protein [Nitrospirae bacterium]|nr:MAG: Hsp20/alpha crystallin family protein [Nitrospirota bacterium]
MAEETKTLQRQESATPAVAEERRRRVYTPPADVFETGETIEVIADMPGVDESSVEITLERNVLTLDGRSTVGAPKDATLSYAEYEPGDYHRAFTLSDEIDREGIKATVKNGVLHLSLPKAGPARAKRIEVRGE